MPIRYQTYLISVLIFILTACTNGEHSDYALLERVESLLPDNPDSADIALNQIETPNTLEGESRALYGLLRTMTDAMLHRGIKSDSLIRPAHTYYKERMQELIPSDETILRYERSAFYLAQFERSVTENFKDADDLFRESAKYSERVKDWHTCYLSYYYLSDLNDVGNHHLAIEYLNKALEYYLKINDNEENLCIIYEEMGFQYYMIDDTVNSFKYTNQAYDIAVEHDFIGVQSDIMRQLSIFYQQDGEYQTALEYAKRGFNGLRDGAVFSAPLLLASCYEDCDSLVQARDILLGMLDRELRPSKRHSIFTRLNRISSKLGDNDAAIIYGDSAYTHYSHTAVGRYKDNSQYGIEKTEQRLTIDNLNERSTRQWIYIAIIIIMSLAYFIYIRYKHRKSINQYQDKILNDITEQQLQFHENTQLRKENDLAQKMLQHKDQTISNMQQIYFMEYTDVRSNINDVDKPLDSEAWEKIESLINMLNLDLIQKLRTTYPCLTELDIQLCMFVLMDIKNSVISDRFAISVDAVKKRKQKLKKSVFGVTDSSTDLGKILRNLQF